MQSFANAINTVVGVGEAQRIKTTALPQSDGMTILSEDVATTRV